MTTPKARDRAAKDARRAWTTGGILLIVSSVLPLAVPASEFSLPGGGLIPSACFSAAVLIFAFGLRGSGSVTGRRPLGTTALVVLATWTFLWPFAEQALVAPLVIDGATWLTLTIGYTGSLVTFAAALVAAVQIARSETIRRPWNWAPGWALAAVTAVWVVGQLIFAKASSGGDLSFVFWLSTLGGLINIAAVLFLGVLAVVLAYGSRQARTVPIFRSDE
ncbi:hypothetical protein [Leifsonia sp. NPDC058230]|uniref:hypothetical protein n=1 Tax=Leifsonia sp. NPDC058230 TaxID=3346391 RepID=UPI0036DF0725